MELLIVLSLVALLASLLFPVLGGGIRRAKDRGCVSRMRQIGLACTFYADDNNGQFPSAVPGYTRWEERMDVKIAPYIGGQPMYITLMKCWRKAPLTNNNVYFSTWMNDWTGRVKPGMCVIDFHHKDKRYRQTVTLETVYNTTDGSLYTRVIP